jgi:NAD(P)H-dependent FMN reductase
MAELLARKPSAVIGTSIGAIGIEAAQQRLRSVLIFCNSPQMMQSRPISSSPPHSSVTNVG